MDVESATLEQHPPRAARGTRLTLLGPVTIVRDGVALPLPASRKVRAAIAYLALAPRAVTRSRLCDLLWELPNDPKGELRWALSKIRKLLDEPGRQRVGAGPEGVTLDLADCFVDALEVGRATQEGLERQPLERLRALEPLFAGDFLDGLELDGSAEFSCWLAAQRCRLRGCHAAVLEHLVALLPPDADEVFGYLDKWLQIATFDRRAHALLLRSLAARGRLHEGDEHVAAAGRLFEAEGLDWGALRENWRSLRAGRHGDPTNADPFITPMPPFRAANDEAIVTAQRRASIAVMPFTEQAREGEAPRRLGESLAHDVITRLAKLRHLFVIAHGTMAALGERSVGTEQAGRMLNVDYVVGGSLRQADNRLTVSIELSEARTARIVWADVIDRRPDDAFDVLDEIGNRIVASIAGEIELAERNRAILKPPNSLTAWEAYHRGLWHMYRYTHENNREAQRFLEMAVRTDPAWARAHAALSFTHFQDVFQRWTERAPGIELAYRSAAQSLAADDRDPTAHWAMGRALWLRGTHEEALAELGRAVELSPSFAHGHYTLAFVHAQSGDPRLGIGSSDHSRYLSPFDPLLCAMLATRALALIRLGRFDEAAEWATRAANRPNAFMHLRAIAALSLGMADKLDDAKTAVAALHAAAPRYRVADLLGTFQFAPDAAELFRKSAKRIALG